uniref:Uncharacterized protein n=1 Tax=Picea glauca TaxID=3330 RepID=A0A117NI71_PICGL|nr:hypothetical protein ABT39_MTgene3979 [Picea glauca]QHR86978.1 hypothetical protein Q903MT_gene987 [Picea sitchensis]
MIMKMAEKRNFPCIQMRFCTSQLILIRGIVK